MIQNPLERFSDRADTYVKYRPSYPDGFVNAVCERLVVEYATDYRFIGHRTFSDDTIRELFAGSQIVKESFGNSQGFDWDGLRSRLESSSYCPKPDHPNYAPLMSNLKDAYDRYARRGKIRFKYETVGYFILISRL